MKGWDGNDEMRGLDEKREERRANTHSVWGRFSFASKNPAGPIWDLERESTGAVSDGNTC